MIVHTIGYDEHGFSGLAGVAHFVNGKVNRIEESCRTACLDAIDECLQTICVHRKWDSNFGTGLKLDDEIFVGRIPYVNELLRGVS